MRVIDRFAERRRLVQVKVLYDGHQGWTLYWDNSSKFKVFYGTSEDFTKFLMKIKAKENDTLPKSLRNMKYSEIVDQIVNGTQHHLWVWETDLNSLN